MVLGVPGPNANADERADPTHTCFTEDITAVWCSYCYYAAEALRQLIQEGSVDFYYVSHVTDRCTLAKDRQTELSVSGFPTVVHDGGYQVTVGATNVQVTKAKYRAYLKMCEQRIVPDLDVDVSYEWLGDAVIRVTTSVTNNDAALYEGRLRTFITETASSMGWNDVMGNPYGYCLLDYAFDEELSINPGETWTDTITWDGAAQSSGMGQTYENIKPDNLTMIAAVYNAEWHQGYYNPPTGEPFDAYYVDQTAAAKAPVNLSADVFTLSEATGGTINFNLLAGRDNSRRNYLLACGVTGSDPGTTLPGGAVLPVNFDVFTYSFFFPLLNTPVFLNFMGKLGADGSGAAKLTTGPLPAGSTGTVLTFAYCLNKPFDYVSVPVDVEIVP